MPSLANSLLGSSPTPAQPVGSVLIRAVHLKETGWLSWPRRTNLISPCVYLAGVGNIRVICLEMTEDRKLLLCILPAFQTLANPCANRKNSSYCCIRNNKGFCQQTPAMDPEVTWILYFLAQNPTPHTRALFSLRFISGMFCV